MNPEPTTGGDALGMHQETGQRWRREDAARPSVMAMAAVATMLLAGTASATEPSEDDTKASDTVGSDGAPGLPHRGQASLRVGFVTGYRMVFRYDESSYCSEPDTAEPAEEQQKICGFGASPALDLALGYAVSDGIEPYLFMRAGLTGEEETNTAPLRVFGVGTRLYTVSDDALKIFLEPAIGYEIEGEGKDSAYSYGGFDPAYDRDLYLHLAVGPQYDFSRYFGAYLDFGVNVSLFRAIASTLEASVGLQLRAP